MRAAFAKSLTALARADDRVLLLTGDHGYSLFDEFRLSCPHQYINAGVAEQNMVGVAAGLAKAGYRPIVYGLSAFVPMRVLEQIKLDVCYEELPVAFIGDGAGLVYGTLGTSHQCTEDIAALRALPHLAILSPADRHEMTACMELLGRATGPVYLRMGKADLGDVQNCPPHLEWGDLCCLHDGPGPLAWIATGSMVSAAIRLARHWPGSAVWSVPCIQPLDAWQVTSICQRYSVLAVLEEHSSRGGLGAAIAEVATTRAPTWICRVGTEDFTHTCGSYQHLLREHGLTLAAIQEKVATFVQRIGVNGIAPSCLTPWSKPARVELPAA